MKEWVHFLKFDIRIYDHFLINVPTVKISLFLITWDHESYLYLIPQSFNWHEIIMEVVDIEYLVILVVLLNVRCTKASNICRVQEKVQS